MRRDVLELRRFYASDLGRAARTMVSRKVEEAWGDAHGLDVLAAFRDHGTAANNLEQGLDDALWFLEELAQFGVNLNEITATDERDPFTGCPMHKYTLCRVDRCE